MKLFSEKVSPTFTSSTLNILTVKNSKEVFFDVYELEINGKTFTAEKVAEHHGNPVVNVPVVIGEEEFIAPFVLKSGALHVEFNTANKAYIGTAAVEVPEQDLKIVEEVYKEPEALPALFLDSLDNTRKASKMIFNEEVHVSVTDIDHNILVTEDYNEVFFDVFEVQVNDKKYNAEKVSIYKGRPVVNVPVVFEGKEYIAPFVLEKGKQEIFFNENNLQFVKAVEEEKIQLPEIEEDVVEDIVFEKKEEILQDISKAKQIAKRYAEDIKQEKINEANSVIRANEQRLDSYLLEAKTQLTDEFLTIIDKTSVSLKGDSDSKAKELTAYIEAFVKKESNKLLSDLDKLNENSVQHFELKIQELVKNIYTDNLTKLINEKSDNNVSRYSKLFASTKTSLEELLNENKEELKTSLDSLKEKVDTGIITLEKSNVVLEDKFQRGLNKALSRAGNVRTDTLKEVDSRIKVTEAKITDVYEATLSEVSQQLDKRIQDVSYINEKIESLTQASKDVTDATKEELRGVKSDVVKLQVEKGLLEEKITESKVLLDKGIAKLNKLNKDIAKENKIYIKEEVDKLTKYNQESSEQAASKLAKFNKNVAKRLQEAKQYIDKEIDGFDSSINKLKKSNTESSKKSIEKIDTFKEDIATQLQEAKDHIHKEVQELDVSIVNLEKTNTEISSKISKAEEAVRKDFFDSIDNTEQVLTSLVESRLKDTNEEINKLLTRKLKTVDSKFKEQLTSKIEESKKILSKEVRVLKESLPKTIENKVQFDKLPDKNEKIDIEGIRRELESKISSRFTQEIATIRRYLDTYGGGGGSVAMQFADGGTMRGDLTVMGTISARDGIPGSGNVDGSGTTNYLPVWTGTEPVDHTIDDSIAFQACSTSTTEDLQLTVMGDISARGSLSASDARFGFDSISIDGPAGTINASGKIESYNAIVAGLGFCTLGGTSCFGGGCVNICQATPLNACGCVRIGQGISGGTPLTISGNVSSNGDLTISGTISASKIIGGNTKVISKGPSLANGALLDSFSTSDMNATKYSIQVLSGSDVHFSDISVTTDGTTTGLVEYGINHTTDDPFVTFGAIVNSNTVYITAQEVGSAAMTNFTFKGNRLNLF